MKRNVRNTTSGFTLLEMVVSIAIVALVATVLSQVFISTLRTNTKTEILKDMKQNGEIALETMVRLIQNAKSVTSECADTGTTGNEVTIVNQDDGETTLGCVLEGSTTRLASVSAASTDYLTSTNVTLGGTGCDSSSLIITCRGGAGTEPSITISFRLAQDGTAAQAFEEASEEFQTSASMRNTIE